MTDSIEIAEEKELETGEIEVDVSDDNKIEVEVEDDTPDEDKGRARKASGVGDGTTEDEDLEKYSGGVQKRIKKLKYDFHEERRGREKAEREREAAIQYAGAQKNEAERLRKNLSEGEGVLVNEAKARVASEMTSAKQEYRRAYEAGDTDAVLEAQMALSSLQLEEDRVKRWQPARAAIAQQAEPPVQRPAPRVAKPDKRAQEWIAENDWFETDASMKRYAMLVHQEVLESGVDSGSELYYSKINEAVRSRYPDSFADEVRQPQRKAGSVVAPGGRNAPASRNKVTLSKSEAHIATRLNIPLHVYAAQKLKDARNAES